MKYYSLNIDKYTIWLYSTSYKESIVTEAKTKGIPLTGPYSYIKHPPHNTTGEDHLHIYCKRNQLFAINKGGTGHDGNSGYRIPNRVADKLRSIFPNWSIPQNNIIERTSPDLTKLLIEIIC